MSGLAAKSDKIVTGNTPLTRPENRAYFPALDGIRALALLMVMGQHYCSLAWGWTGVDFFFVLSGFLITGICFDSRHDRHRARNFYVRRTLRIFPLYYGVMLVVLASTPIYHLQWSRAWLAWPLYLGNYLRFWHPYVVGTPWQRIADAQPGHYLLGHFWSLCVEEQFYLVWPWFVFLVPTRRALLWICGTAVVLAPLARVYAAAHLSQNMLNAEVLYRATPFRIDALLLGGFAALWLRGPYRGELLRYSRWLFGICVAAALPYVSYGVYRYVHLQLATYPYPAWKFTWGLSFIDVFALSLLLVCLTPGTWPFRLFHWRPLRWLGRISYGAYVFHDVPHVLVDRFVRAHLPAHGHFGLKAFAVALMITTVVAWLSFRFFESPFLNLKERWTIRGAA